MQQLIGSIRDRNKRVRTPNSRLSNPNLPLEARLDRESITSIIRQRSESDDDDLPNISEDSKFQHNNKQNESSPGIHIEHHSSTDLIEEQEHDTAADKLDSDTCSRLSALLEIRREASLQSSVTSGFFNAKAHSNSLYGKLSHKVTKCNTEHTVYRSPHARHRRSAADLGGNLLRHENETCFPSLSVFHPYSSPRMVWDLAIIVMILYTSIAVPLRLSWSMNENLTIWILDRLLDFLFIIDIFINFNTAFERGTELIVDRKSIVAHYVRSWFPLDFVASFPFDFVISILNGGNILDFDSASNSSLSLLPRLVRLFKLSRLFRLARLQRILRRVQLQLGIRNSTNKILKFSGAAILCAHWMACMFYATSTVGSSSSLGDFPSWVERLNADGKNQLDSNSVAHTYIASLYWSLTTMTSIGYGDVSPKTPSERIFGIFGMICGAVLFGHFMGNVLAVVADMSPAENEFHLKMDMLSQYMKEQNLPAELRRQIEEFYHIEHKLNNYQVDEAEMLRELPDRLKRELSLAISKRILGNVPLFDGMSPSFVRTVGLSMERRVYPQGEYVIREGEEVNQFYILTAGRAYLMQDDMVIGAISNGDYFGSIPIHWKQFERNTKSTYSVRTLEWTEVRSLSIARFRQLIVEFPDAKDILVQRIVDNILEQNKNVDPAAKCVVENDAHDVNDVESESEWTQFTNNKGASLSADIDRDQLIRFVESALCLTDNNKNKQYAASSHRRESLIPELKKEFAASSILKDLRAFKIEELKAVKKENLMKFKINRELHHFDGLFALLSLMVEIASKSKLCKSTKSSCSKTKTSNNQNIINCDSENSVDAHAKEEEELLHYIQCICDRELLPKLTKLRKVIEYVFIANADEYIDDDDDAAAAAEEGDKLTSVERHMNSFFRPFIFIESVDSLKLIIQNLFTHNHKRKRNLKNSDSTNTIELTNRLLYHGTSVEYHQSLELMFFKLGYKPTFAVNRRNLDTCISQDFFDILILDNDDIIEMEETLQLISKPKVRSAINLLFLVSNNMNYNKLFKIAKKYDVHVLLRKPILYQDLHQMFDSIGLLMFA